MPAARLTAAQCAAARVDPDRVIYLPDGHGLRLCVRPNGSKAWQLRVHVKGREQLVGLGAYPGTSLARARDEAKAIRDRIRDGEPAREPKRDEGATLNDLADAFIRHASRDWSDHHRTRNKYLLDNFLKPKLGKYDPRDIDRAAILAALKEPLSSAPESARRARGLLSQILAYGVDVGACEHNPASELARNTLFKRGKVEHFAALATPDIGPMLRKLEASDCPPATKVALFVVLVTALREGSVRAAKWSEFDEHESLWRVPAARMKSRRAFDVPLPQAVFDALKTLPRADDVEYVFASPHSKSGYLAENTLRLALHGIGFKVTAHGCRSTFQDWATSKGFHHDHIERYLDHTPKGIRAAYLRSDLLPQRRALAEAWCQFVVAERERAPKVAIKELLLSSAKPRRRGRPQLSVREVLDRADNRTPRSDRQAQRARSAARQLVEIAALGKRR